VQKVGCILGDVCKRVKMWLMKRDWWGEGGEEGFKMPTNRGGIG